MKPESLAALGAVPLDDEAARALGFEHVHLAWFGGTPPRDLPEIIGDAAKSMAEFWSEPGNQAYMAGCVVGAAFAPKMRLLPGIIVTIACGLAARGAYRLAEDIRKAVQNADA